jgi:hypothetical protein
LYWPISRADHTRHALSLLKGLRGYDVAARDFVFSDSLLPWRGYIAYYQGEADSVIELLAAPPRSEGIAKTSAAGIGFGLRLAGAASVYLGAIAGGSPGEGVEDEPQASPPRETGARLWALRQGRRLGTDFTAWDPAKTMRWSVAARPGGRGQSNSSDSVTRGIQVGGFTPQSGIEVWAVSRGLGLKSAVVEGATLPLGPGPDDTLDFYAGSAEAVRAALASVPATVSDFGLEVIGARDGFALSLRVREPIRLRWGLWDLAGRSAGGGERFLPRGIYLLPVSGRPGRRLSGVHLLTAAWEAAGGSGPSGRLSRRLALP